MSQQFRFPRSTIFLMLLVFVGVILAIDSAVKVAADGAWESHSLSLKLAIAIVPLYLIVSSLGAVGFAILFGLRRSGVHRLTSMQTWLKK